MGSSRPFWEHDRELATITKDGTTWTNTYNQDGMRIRRTNGTVTYGYVYNGSQLSRDFRRHPSARGITHRLGGYRGSESETFIGSWFG